MSIRTYSELVKMDSFEERFRYLKLTGKVGESTFGYDRVFNQKFYSSIEWKRIRDHVIFRDNGCDLGIEDRPLYDKLFIHHINPIMLSDIRDATDILLNPEYLITCSFQTHNAIHYGDEKLVLSAPIERSKNDTCPWKH